MRKLYNVILFLFFTLNSIAAVSLSGGIVCIDYPRALSEMLPDTVYAEYSYATLRNSNAQIQNDSIYGISTGSDSLLLYNSSGDLIAYLDIEVKEYTDVDSIIVSDDSIVLYKGGSQQLYFYFLPSDADIYDTTLLVDDTNIAEVTSGGILTGKEEGQTSLKIALLPSGKEITVDIYVLPCDAVTPTVIETTHVCNGDEAVLYANTRYAYWYSDSLLTDLLGQGAVFQPDYQGIGTEVYYVAAYGDDCVSDYATATLQVHEQNSEPDVENFPDEYNYNYIDTVDFEIIYNWYKASNLSYIIYSGTNLPEGLTCGEHTYYISQGNVCESDQVEYSFTVENDSIRISGIINNADADFEGVAQLISYPELQEEYQTIFTGTEFDILIRQQGEYVLKIIALTDGYKATVYYGNAVSVEDAYIIAVGNYNIGGLEIDMGMTTDIQNICDKDIEINISNGILLFDADFTAPVPYIIYSIHGQKMRTGLVTSGTNSIVLDRLASGVYILNILDFSYTFIVD